MAYLRDIKEKKNIKNIILGLLFGIIAVLIQFYPIPYKVILSVVTFLASSLFLLSTTRLMKFFEDQFTDKVCTSDSIGIVLLDKDGKIKKNIHKD